MTRISLPAPEASDSLFRARGPARDRTPFEPTRSADAWPHAIRRAAAAPPTSCRCGTARERAPPAFACSAPACTRRGLRVCPLLGELPALRVRRLGTPRVRPRALAAPPRATGTDVDVAGPRHTAREPIMGVQRARVA